MLYGFVMLGGLVAAICRYAMGEWISVDGFPFGTLSVNLIGCLFLGWFLTKVTEWTYLKKEIILMIGTGFVGSFTTFSTFSVETLNLLQAGKIVTACLYVLSSILIGLALTFTGFLLAKKRTEKGDPA
jgi:CrcB protein